MVYRICGAVIFDAITEGSVASLKKLKVMPHYDDVFEDRMIYMEEEAADLGEVVAKALRSTKLSRLEELELSTIPMVDADIIKIAAALQEGTCRSLRVLSLSGFFYCQTDDDDDFNAGRLGPAGAEALGQALRAGSMPQLEELWLSDNKSLGDEGVKNLTEAFKAGACPKLKVLSFHNVGMTAEGAKAVGRAMAAGYLSNLKGFRCTVNAIGDAGMKEIAKALATSSVPKLEQINLISTGVGDEGVKSLGEALQAGGCPLLRVLILRGRNVEQAGGRAIINALASKSCPKLVMLNLESCKGVGEEGLADLFKGLGEGCCPDLSVLSVSRCGMARVAGNALVKAMKKKEWPRLKQLDIEYNEELGDRVGAGIARALEGPAGSKIQSLNITEIGLNPMGAGRMAKALEDGACPKLVNLHVTSL